jgi:hypothetical protein
MEVELERTGVALEGSKVAISALTYRRLGGGVRHQDGGVASGVQDTARVSEGWGQGGQPAEDRCDVGGAAAGGDEVDGGGVMEYSLLGGAGA